MGFWNNVYQVVRRFKLVAKEIAGLPLAGEFNDRFIVDPPRLLTKKYGKTSKMPTVLEILVEDKAQGKFDAGKIVKNDYFPDTEKIIFNVCFSCAKPSLFRGGDYANPVSHWFNVFFGFYEIDVVKGEWNRPFGFVDDSPNANINFDDLAKIGKADWNIFSNYVYGVPIRECEKYTKPDPDIKSKIINPKVIIGKNEFIEAQLDGVKVVSGYASGQDGRRLLYNDKIWSAIWRTVFGRPKKNKKYPKSFISTNMKMRFYIRFTEEYDDDLKKIAYKTFIYGGTVNNDCAAAQSGHFDNDAFLQAQMDGVKMAAKNMAFQKRKKPKRKAPWL